MGHHTPLLPHQLEYTYEINNHGCPESSISFAFTANLYNLPYPLHITHPHSILFSKAITSSKCQAACRVWNFWRGCGLSCSLIMVWLNGNSVCLLSIQITPLLSRFLTNYFVGSLLKEDWSEEDWSTAKKELEREIQRAEDLGAHAYAYKCFMFIKTLPA